VFGLGFASIVIILWARFALGSLNLNVPVDSLQISSNRIIWIRLLSSGFLVVALAVLANLVPVLTSPVVRLLVDPLPLEIIFCIPGLIAIRRLRAHLETQGNQAKPLMLWLDRGVLAGWSALCLGLFWWLLFSLPTRLPL
jgi:hypothetical protein